MTDSASEMNTAPGGTPGAGPADVVAGAHEQGEFSQPSVMGQWAAMYASQGMHVMPLYEGEKRPRIEVWESAASNDAATVAAWWRQWPNANIGWAVGRDGYVVIDCDTKTEQGGRYEVDQWLAGKDEELPATLTAKTGSGGQHLIFRLPDGVTVGNRTGVLDDVDVRGVGGQIVLPPSLHRSGQRYEWVGEFTLGRVAPVPELLLNLIGSGKNGDGGKSTITGQDSYDILINGVPNGKRDDDIFGLCVRELKEGSSPTAVLALAREVGRASDWTMSEAEAKWQQAMKFVIASPPDVLPGWHPERSTPEASAGASDDDSVLGGLLDGLDPKTLEVVQTQQRLRRAKAIVREMEARSEFVAPRTTFDLAEELAIEDGPVSWTVDGLHQRGMNSTIAAQFKTGKTTLLLNLMRSLIDGEPFLDHLAVRPISGRVAFLNYELGDGLYRQWVRDVGIQRPDRGAVLSLRGRRLDVDSDVGRAFLIDWLREREVEAMIVDPFARAFGGKENDGDEVKRWTDNMDVIKFEAGVEDLFLTTHTGRNKEEERSRGATRIDDWPDSLWFLSNQDGKRFLGARGRDIDFAESELVMVDPQTRRLALGELGHGRKEAKAEGKNVDLVPKVLSALKKKGDGVSQRELRDEVPGNAKEVVAAIKDAVAQGLITVESGKNRAQLHALTDEGRQRLDSAVANIWVPGGI